jgi:hypothetical protein
VIFSIWTAARAVEITALVLKPIRETVGAFDGEDAVSFIVPGNTIFSGVLRQFDGED